MREPIPPMGGWRGLRGREPFSKLERSIGERGSEQLGKKKSKKTQQGDSLLIAFFLKGAKK